MLARATVRNAGLYLHSARSIQEVWSSYLGAIRCAISLSSFARCHSFRCQLADFNISERPPRISGCRGSLCAICAGYAMAQQSASELLRRNMLVEFESKRKDEIQGSALGRRLR